MGIDNFSAHPKHPVKNRDNTDDTDLKIAQFSTAMNRYQNNHLYSQLELSVSILVVLFQSLTLINLFQTYNRTSPAALLFVFIIAYLITDFINGLVHMFMDNNTRYESRVGPFIASFHLHHANPRYTKKHPLKIYFFESGTKFWLLGYLVVLAFLQNRFALSYEFNCCLVFIGVLSSVAEVSHYWCHNTTQENKITQVLQKYRLLLSKQHHAHHHHSDNTHYAFLNGLSDPILNMIARSYYNGYKNESDKHIAAYLKSIQIDAPEKL